LGKRDPRDLLPRSWEHGRNGRLKHWYPPQSWIKSATFSRRANSGRLNIIRLASLTPSDLYHRAENPARPERRPTVALLLPVLNEIGGMRRILPTIDRSLFDDILVVDGGSSDGTPEFAMDQGLRVMTQLRKGIGFGVLDAIATLDTDCVIEFSPDGNCEIAQLPLLVAKLHEGYEVVVISRYLPPAKSYDDTLITGFGNWMFTKMIRFLGRYPVTDGLTIYRGFRRAMVDDPAFSKNVYGPVFEPLVSAVGQLRNLRICEIAGDEPKRFAGESKMGVVYNGSCILLMVIRIYLTKFGLR